MSIRCLFRLGRRGSGGEKAVWGSCILFGKGIFRGWWTSGRLVFGGGVNYEAICDYLAVYLSYGIKMMEYGSEAEK